MIKGRVLGLDRVHSVAAVSLVSGVTVTAAYVSPAPPPTSVVLVEDLGNGAWVVLGTLGERRLVMHEDFTASNPPAIGAAFVSMPCDTTWSARGAAAAGSIFSAGTLPSGDLQAVGAVGVQTGALAAQWVQFSKTSTLSLPTSGAYWISMRVAVHQLANTLARYGAADNTLGWAFGGLAAGFRALWLEYDSASSPNWVLTTIVDGGRSNLVSSMTVAVDTWVNADLVIAPGSWAAMWLNGSYVGKLTASIPEWSNNVLALGAGLYPRGAAAVFGYVDFIHSEQIALTIQPA